MRPFTLVTKKLYFGVDANRMRDASARVLARLRSQTPARAVIRLEALVEDFRVSAAASRPMIDEMLRHGLLEQQDTRGSEYSITDKFRRYASAEIIEPLPRARAKMLLTHIADLAWQFNRSAHDNKYEIEALAVFGDYMSLAPELEEVTLGLTGRRRPPPRNPAAGRATQALHGREQIRALFEGQSRYVRTHFFLHLDDVPKPFSVLFKSHG
jgi:DNA-binding IclR family transcriptional regulator